MGGLASSAMRRPFRAGQGRAGQGSRRGLCDAGAAHCNRSGLEGGRWPLKWAAAAGDAALGWQQSSAKAGVRGGWRAAVFGGRSHSADADFALAEGVVGVAQVSATLWPAETGCKVVEGGWESARRLACLVLRNGAAPLSRRIGFGAELVAPRARPEPCAHTLSCGSQAPDDCRCNDDAASKATRSHHKDHRVLLDGCSKPLEHGLIRRARASGPWISSRSTSA